MDDAATAAAIDDRRVTAALEFLIEHRHEPPTEKLARKLVAVIMAA